LKNGRRSVELTSNTSSLQPSVVAQSSTNDNENSNSNLSISSNQTNEINDNTMDDYDLSSLDETESWMLQDYNEQSQQDDNGYYNNSNINEQQLSNTSNNLLVIDDYNTRTSSQTVSTTTSLKRKPNLLTHWDWLWPYMVP
ncbi:unnamed protein product, partial [Didymodactylos carnosus]